MQQTKKNWHKFEQLNEDTWRIIEGDIISCYLLLGRERAMLIDTGNGMGNIGSVVRQLTDLPVVVALTHRHCDHVGGRGWFNTPAHVHKADMTALMWLFSTRLAARIISGKWTTSKDFLRHPYKAGYTVLSHGAQFDLGGRVVAVEHLPGHTAGSVAYLDRKHKMLFGGDNIRENEVWMFLPGSLPMEVWLTSAKRILELCDEYTPYSGHGGGVMTAAQIERLIAAAEKVIATKKNSFFHGREEVKDEDGTPLIVYDPAIIHAKKRRSKKRTALR